MLRLIFKDGEFTEVRERSGDAILHLDEVTQSAKLEYSEGTGLVLRRTARRQAENICKSGYQLKNGLRIGAGFDLVVEEDEIDGRLLQTGHDYR
ncbi:MAG: hypothetical protein ACFFE8_06060 [Candidatus Heimdallarchaeota archaeon]